MDHFIFMFQTLLLCVPKKKVLHMYEGAKMTEFFLFIYCLSNQDFWSDLYMVIKPSVVTRS